MTLSWFVSTKPASQIMDLPTGYSPPAYSNTPDDHRGWAVIASSVGLVFILTLASIRSYTRNPFRSRLLWEDAAIIVAVVSSLIQRVRLFFTANDLCRCPRSRRVGLSSPPCHRDLGRLRRYSNIIFWARLSG
jgi:hypothetical protein